MEKVKTFLVFSCGFAFCILSFAFPAFGELASASYKIPALVVTSGGATEMSSANYKLMDSKGFYGGAPSSASYIIQVGPSYALVVPAEAVAAPGTVALTIAREGDDPGSDIVIGWEGNTPDIWCLTGDGEGRYTVDVNGWAGEDGVGHPWQKVLDGRGGVLEAGMAADFELNVGQRRLKHRDQVGEADQDREVYYKGFVAGTVPDAVHPEGGTFISQAVAVGKINVVLDKEWNLVGIPFEVAENLDAGGNNLGNLNNVLGRGIFARDDQVWVYDRGFSYASYNDAPANWPTNISLTKGRGFWLYLANQRTLTLVGQVFSGDFAKEIAGGWNLLANPYPAVFDISEATSGLNAPERDDQLWWYKRGFSYESARGDPVLWPADKNIIPGAGFWYYRNVQPLYNWQMSLP